MKKFLSIFLAGIMLACMIPTVAFAEDAPSGIFVGETQYTSIDAAAAAAYNTTSKTITIRGSVEVGSRQTIAYEGVKLVGETGSNAKLVATTAFANASATNKKALFTITASNVQVTNVAFDGSAYGDTLPDANNFFDFVVVRINSGTGIILDDVSITGSKKTLLQIGTSSTSATVTASDLTCNGYYKALPATGIFSTQKVYADVDITNNSTLTLSTGCTINGFVTKSANSTFNFPQNAFYLFTYKKSAVLTYNAYASARYLVDAYEHAIVSGDIDANELISLLTYHGNLSAVQSIVTNAVNETPLDIPFITSLKAMVDAAIVKVSTNTELKNALETCSATLAAALQPQA